MTPKNPNNKPEKGPKKTDVTPNSKPPAIFPPSITSPKGPEKPKTPPPSKPKALFILKRRSVPYYDEDSNTYSTSSGLSNSARFVVDMLIAKGFDTEIEQAIDNNCIDRLVTKHRPTHVFIEAVWVVPEKFNVLRRLHPTVKWIIRYHSAIPFLSQEGVALRWAMEYIKQENVSIAPNCKITWRDLTNLVATANPSLTDAQLADKVLYLPNYYPVGTYNAPFILPFKSTIDVGCFGAIRPLKNQLIQAVAAVEFARQQKLGLRFHINGDRIEQKGDNGLKNIRALFDELPTEYQLVQHPWLTHDHFIPVVRDMDIGLQLSFTETFNIVTADFVTQGVPVVVSPEVEWVSPLFQANPTDVDDIVQKMSVALRWKRFFGGFFSPNESNLRKYDRESEVAWTTYLNRPR